MATGLHPTLLEWLVQVAPVGWVSAAALGTVSAREEAALSPRPFEELLTPLLGSAYGTAVHLTRNRADAEDLVQEAALQAFRAYHTFLSGSNFRAWFFKILSHAFISRYRKHRKERGDVSLEGTPDLYLFTRTAEAGMHGPNANPAQALLGKLDEEQVGAALESLPDEYRSVATLYFIEDFSYQQIADILDVPVGTVRSRLHRGRKMLQRALWTTAQEQGIVPGGSA